MVLLVDDEQELRLYFAGMIAKECGVGVLRASSVDEALELIKNVEIKLIISDYNMPRKNGDQLIQSLVKLDIRPYFILFTSAVEHPELPPYEKFLEVIDKSRFQELVARVKTIEKL